MNKRRTGTLLAAGLLSASLQKEGKPGENQ